MPTEDGIERKKKPSNAFLTKLNEKGTQPNKNAVLADSKCTGSIVHLWYGNVTIQLYYDWITWTSGYDT